MLVGGQTVKPEPTLLVFLLTKVNVMLVVRAEYKNFFH